MSYSLLSERLTSLRTASKKASQIATCSSNNNSVPLSLFLAIHSKTPKECYINYNEGSKALLTWLTSSSNPDGTARVSKPLEYPAMKELEHIKIPRLLNTYQLGELAKLLATDACSHIERDYNFSLYLTELKRAEKAIYLTMKEMY